MNKHDIIGIDILWFDELVTIKKMPEENLGCLINDTSYQGGGKVSTALVAASRQGVSCKIIGVAGTSSKSRFLTEDFQRHNIDISAIKIIDGYSEGFSIVLSDEESSGRRILWSYDYTQPYLTFDDIDNVAQEIAKAEYLHLCRMDNIDCYAAAVARKAQTKVCLDADFYSEDIVRSLGLVDILIGSAEFYEKYFNCNKATESNLEHIATIGPEIVIFTFGKNGCKGYSKHEGHFTVSAHSKNINVVDTVGAGDVFHGGFLAALCQGYNAKQAANYASVVSAIKCTAIGGRAGIPTKEMVDQYLLTQEYPTHSIEKRIAYYKKFR